MAAQERTVEGAWRGELTGGCPNYNSWRANPLYRLAPSQEAEFTVRLTQRKATADGALLQIGVMVLTGEADGTLGALTKETLLGKTKWKATSKPQTLTLTLGPPPSGKAIIVLPCTHEPGKEGSFTLSVSSGDPAFELAPIGAAAEAAAPVAPVAPATFAAPPPLSPPAPARAVSALPPARHAPVAPTSMASLAGSGAVSAQAALAAALSKHPARPFEDAEFETGLKIPSHGIKSLYAAKQQTKGKKVDSWARLSAMGGGGVDGSLLQLREGPAEVTDGWLMGALGMVSTNTRLTDALVASSPPEVGMHVVRLYKDGEWINVTVDDVLPCHGKHKPAYSSNAEPRDGPAALVQKALAKLYGCYEQLRNGRVGAALVDLTGGSSDKVYLRDGLAGADGALKQPQIVAADEIASGAMWTRLSTRLAQGHLLGATHKAKYADAGVPPAMAPAAGTPGASLVYPIVEMREVDGVQMVRLKQVWKIESKMVKGNAAPEWKGAWGNMSDEWQNRPGVASQLGGKPRDGSFWMEWADFTKGFNKVHICYLPRQHTASLKGEWAKGSAGGCLSKWPGTRWRDNPQYTLSCSQKCKVMLSVAQPDAQLDAVLESDTYLHAVGFYILYGDAAGAPPRRKLGYRQDEIVEASRLAKTRQVCREVEIDPQMSYVVIPCSLDANVMLPYTLTATSDFPISFTPTPSSADLACASASGAWSKKFDTSGGAMEQSTWAANPQFSFTLGSRSPFVGVLSLDLNAKQEAELKARSAEGAQQAVAALAPAIGFAIVKSDGGALSGAYDASKEAGRSEFVHVSEVVLERELGAGTYTLVAATQQPGGEAHFKLECYANDPGLKLTPVAGSAGGLGRSSGVARAQSSAAPPGAGRAQQAPPKAKHDVAATRAKARAAAAAGAPEDDMPDDGKMGYAERMEMEELVRLEKWKENVPMMTVEGQPLTENVKKECERKIQQAVDWCAAHPGQKFVDDAAAEGIDGGFPRKPGTAAGPSQPEVYAEDGSPQPGMPIVTQWLRPEEMNFDQPGPPPVLFKNDYEVEGVVQQWDDAGNDNRWLLSTLNIVAGNREQLDRAFMDMTHAEQGFFVVKIYRDDPFSDDDWQVVLVDDRVPCDANGKPAFARNADERVYWVMILEKAYAKFAGSYSQMAGGTVTQGLEDITGGIGYKYNLLKEPHANWIPKRDGRGGEMPDMLWQEIMEKMKTEHVIGCNVSVKAGDSRPMTTAKGIVVNRAYALVTGGEFEDNKLMRLRIPLDENGECREWTGRWSDKSSAWTGRLKQMLSYANKDDGTFWIEYKDFCAHMTKVYMCRMLDDLWTRFTVKSRWMDETAGGCTNHISWRSNNQWILKITRPNTKLVIKLTQPDARKTAGHGRHYSNAIGFYIMRGNEQPTDYNRRKLTLDPNDPDEVVFDAEPRFTRQLIKEYTFEEPSETPFILLPYLFEAGRESLFKLTILSDDRDDDGEPDFGFQEVKPEEDWRRTTLQDSWSRGGEGNALGVEDSAGGPVGGPWSEGDKPAWTKNWQYQITLPERSRCYVFLELRDIDYDMRDKAGLQTEPEWLTVGFVLCKGEGDHVKLDHAEPEILQTAKLRRGDGQWLDIGYLDPDGGDKYVIIPYVDTPGVEHKFALTLYTDLEHKFEKIIPRLCLVDCVQCGSRSGLARVFDKLANLEDKYAMMVQKEQALCAKKGIVAKPNFDAGASLGGSLGDMLARAGCTPAGAPAPSAATYATGSAAAQRAFDASDANKDGKLSANEHRAFTHFQQLDADKDGVVSASEIVAYKEKVEDTIATWQKEHQQVFEQHMEAQLEQQRANYERQLRGVASELEEKRNEAATLRSQLAMREGAGGDAPPSSKGGSKLCAIQ